LQTKKSFINEWRAFAVVNASQVLERGAPNCLQVETAASVSGMAFECTETLLESRDRRLCFWNGV